MAKLDSQTTMLEHSQAKVKLLERYLVRYLNVISNDGFTEGINLYDLFCGEGVYDNGGEGSPIVTLKVLKNLHFSSEAKNRKLPKVNLLLNDIDPSKVEKLKGIIAEKKLHYPNYGSLNFENKDYKKVLDELVDKILKFRNEKAFIFIDPYGYKEIRASEIKRLLQSKKSEVLLFLPTQFMYRFDEKGTPQSLIEILSEIVDYSQWKSTNSVYSFITQFTEGLRSYLGTDFYVDTFTIQKDPNTVYCLFFFSSHIRGFEKMLEAKWELDEEQGKGFRYEKTMSLFSQQKTNPLEEKLTVIIKNHKVYNCDIYKHTLFNGFLPTHANEILASWQDEGKLSVLTDEGEKVRKGAFYINYKNYKEEPNKVYFKFR